MEVVTDRPERYVAILAATDQLDATVSRYASGERGPDEHIHREHADCFFVLEGSLLFLVGGEPVVGDAGTFVLVPPEVVHTFRNESGGDARFLNLHAPSGGFADYMRGKSPTFDSFDPPEDGGRPASDALVSPPGAGDRIAFEGGEALLRADTDWLSLTEVTFAPGFSYPIDRPDRVLQVRVPDAPSG